MAKLLKNLTVHEVSLVGSPANRKKFALTKSAEVLVSDEVKTEPAVEAAPAAEAAPVALLKADGTPDEEALAKLDPVLRPQFEALFKAQADAVKAQAEAVAKAAALEATLATEKETAEVKEAISKAAVDFAGLPAKAEDLGPALRVLRKADAAAAELVENVLKSCKALVGQALEPVGKAAAADESTSTMEKVMKRAADMVAKGEAKTKEIAFSKILESDKALYAAIQAEKDQ
jgi:hypothetical protein